MVNRPESNRQKAASLSAMLLALLMLSGCGNGDSDYDRGYDDGNAVGYNLVCGHGSSMIWGDWDNKHYAKGYAEGMEDGVKEGLRECA